jgi:hypothetical protein
MISRLIPFIICLALAGCSFNTPNPCVLTIEGTKQRFSTNDPIYISYNIRNTSKDTVRIWHCGFWCNNKIVVTNENHVELSRTDWGRKTLSAFSPGGPRDKNYPTFLAPGATDFAYEKYNLRDHFLFEKAGIYHVVHVYHEIDDKAEIKIQSNTLRIEIVN